MQLEDQSGIICDKCGEERKEDFVYYSLDIYKYQASGRQPDPATLFATKPVKSLDYCEVCYGTLADTVVRTYAHNQKKKSVHCEITGELVMPGKPGFYCVAAKVTVRISGANLECQKCGAPAKSPITTCSSCSHDKFVKRGSVRPELRILEFHLVQQALDKLERTAKAKQWTTR